MGQSAGMASTGEFDELLALIEAARLRAYQAVNSELVGLYWQLGEYISQKIESAQWGAGVVDELAAAIARQYPGMRGYARRNLFRMCQFFDAYRDQEKVSPALTQIQPTAAVEFKNENRLEFLGLPDEHRIFHLEFYETKLYQEFGRFFLATE